LATSAKQEYLKKPAAVEVYRLGDKTDVIIRQNITKVKKTNEDAGKSYTVYECDEVQYRYSGIVTKDTIEADMETWLAWEPEDTTTPSAEDDMDAMLVDHEYRLTLLELGLTE